MPEPSPADHAPQAATSAVVPGEVAETPPTTTPPEEAPRAARPRGRFVNPEAALIDAQLRNARLAEPWQRAGAMVVDLMAVGLLSLLTGPVLGLLTGVTLATLGSRRVSSTRFWQGFRWVLIVLGASVALLSGFRMIGRPIIRTSAFNMEEVAKGPNIESIYVRPDADSRELRRAVTLLQKQVDELKVENAGLRESARGNALLNVVADSSRTLGLTFGWAGVYFTLCTAWLGGRTPGKLAFRTRVVRLDGRRITPMDAFTRYGGYAAGLATGSIGFLRLLWEPNRQAIQDKIAATIVVRV